MTLHQIQLKIYESEQRWHSQAKALRRRYEYLDTEPQTLFNLRRFRQLRNQVKFRKMVYRSITQNAEIRLLSFQLIEA